MSGPTIAEQIQKLAPYERDDLLRQARIAGPTLTALRTGRSVNLIRQLLDTANAAIKEPKS